MDKYMREEEGGGYVLAWDRSARSAGLIKCRGRDDVKEGGATRVCVHECINIYGGTRRG